MARFRYLATDRCGDLFAGLTLWVFAAQALVEKIRRSRIGGWTYGALVNHIWSVAGDRDRADIGSTFLQPFLSYTTKTHTTFGVNTETTYDWEAKQ